MKILLGVSGSVACKLTPKFQAAILKSGHELKTVITESVINFIPCEDFKAHQRCQYLNWLKFYRDHDEYYEINSVLHIDLVTWADRFIVAPCTANTLAKISHGFADNLLTNCVRAWDFDKRMDIALAMNTQMYKSPLTTQQTNTMTKLGALIHAPVVKKLVCGVEGIGAMAQIDDILNS